MSQVAKLLLRGRGRGWGDIYRGIAFCVLSQWTQNPGVQGARRQIIGPEARNPDLLKSMNDDPGRDRTLDCSTDDRAHYPPCYPD